MFLYVNITEGIDSAVVLDDKSICAACGKEGNSDNMNICNKCKMVKYCNAACKKKHRTKHKKGCERRVAELHEEQLFKEIEPDECPICLLPMPSVDQTSVNSCCGKNICNGCIYAMEMSEGKDLCPFCPTPPASSDKEEIKRVKKLIDEGNAEACFLLAAYYDDGTHGLPQDQQKANELYLKAGELGCAGAYYNLGVSYDKGYGVEIDKKKAKHYFELAAAMNGHVDARYNLGVLEEQAGNDQRSIKHFMIAAKAGDEGSLDSVKNRFKKGLVSKDEYANTLRAYQTRQEEMKSDERDKAAIEG